MPELAELPDPVEELIDAAIALEAEEAGYCGDVAARSAARKRLKGARAALRRRLAGGVTDAMVVRACNSYFDSLPPSGGEAANTEAMRAALVAALGAK